MVPRANRYIPEGRTDHVTHRGHNRAYLLKCKKDRNLYRSILRARLNRSRSPASLRGYCLTSNHVHLLPWAGSKVAIANLMQSPAVGSEEFVRSEETTLKTAGTRKR